MSLEIVQELPTEGQFAAVWLDESGFMASNTFNWIGGQVHSYNTVMNDWAVTNEDPYKWAAESLHYIVEVSDANETIH